MSRDVRSTPQNPPPPYQARTNQVDNNNTGSGTQHNYNAPYQNINHGRDQNIHSGQRHFPDEQQSRTSQITNNNTGSGTRHNYDAPGQNIDRDGNQDIIYSSRGPFHVRPEQRDEGHRRDQPRPVPPVSRTNQITDNNTSSGAQHNYGAPGQNINHGRDQNIHYGQEPFHWQRGEGHRRDPPRH